MSIFALLLGACIGLLSWSFLAHLSFAVHDAANKTTLAAKLAEKNSGTLTRMLWWAAAAIAWLVVFVGACLHFAHPSSSRPFLAWLFGGVATTPTFIAFTTIRWLRRLKQINARREQL